MIFATILLTCSPTFPLILFNKFAPAMEEDFVYDMKRLFGRFESEENIASIARHKLLHTIQELLEEAHHTNGDFQILVTDPTIHNATSIAMQNEYDPDADADIYFLENIEKMNDGQRVIFDFISTKITKCEGGMFSLDAFSDAGKTFLSNL